MAARVHHIGITVPNLEAAAKFFHDVFGVGTRSVEDEKAKNLYIPFGDFQLQICEDPNRLGDAPFGRLDHIALNVDDLDETTERLKAHGVEMVWDPPTTLRQYRINFTTEHGGVGVQFQLSDELAYEREGQEFKPGMMEAVTDKIPAQRRAATIDV
jgi:catechol 2,3-dioxygenase-like lactoylglutathione lyase family enzyme